MEVLCLDECDQPRKRKIDIVSGDEQGRRGATSNNQHWSVFSKKSPPNQHNHICISLCLDKGKYQKKGEKDRKTEMPWKINQ